MWRKLASCSLASQSSAMVAFTPEGTGHSALTIPSEPDESLGRGKCTVRNAGCSIPHLKLTKQKACTDTQRFQGTDKSCTPIQSLPYSLSVFYWAVIDCNRHPFCNFYLVPFSLLEMLFVMPGYRLKWNTNASSLYHWGIFLAVLLLWSMSLVSYKHLLAWNPLRRPNNKLELRVAVVLSCWSFCSFVYSIWNWFIVQPTSVPVGFFAP